MPYKNPARRREYQAAWVRQNRLDAIELLGGKCVECGSTHRLEIDHVDPATKVSHRIWSWSKARRLAELAKCQVLCSTHHLAKTLRYANITPSEILKVHKSGCGCGGCQNARSLERVAAFRNSRPLTSTEHRTVRRAEARVDKYDVFN